jgi:hypothetical protein
MPAHGKKHEDKKAEPVPPQPGTAAMAQGQQDAGVEPSGGVPEPQVDPQAKPQGDPQDVPLADRMATGAGALEEQQTNPELKDNSGTHS